MFIFYIKKLLKYLCTKNISILKYNKFNINYIISILLCISIYFLINITYK